ncbi:hypothetical protein Efla_006484 [Eimeria flavescens]
MRPSGPGGGHAALLGAPEVALGGSPPSSRSRRPRGGEASGSPSSPSFTWDRPGFLVKRVKAEPQEAESSADSPASRGSRGPHRGAPQRPPSGSLETIDLTGATDSSSDEDAAFKKGSRGLPKREPPPGRPQSWGPSRKGLRAADAATPSSESQGAPKRGPPAMFRGARKCLSAAEGRAPPSEGAPLASDAEIADTHEGPTTNNKRGAPLSEPIEVDSGASAVSVCSSEGEDLIPSRKARGGARGAPSKAPSAAPVQRSAAAAAAAAAAASCLADSLECASLADEGQGGGPLSASGSSGGRSPLQQALHAGTGAPHATQSSPTLRRHLDPFFGTAGKIARVVLRDFCNHESFEWKPSPSVNLILGGLSRAPPSWASSEGPPPAPVGGPPSVRLAESAASLRGNGQGKSAIAKAIFVCCGAERAPARDGGASQVGGGPERGPKAATTASLVKSGERPRLFEYIRDFWSEGGPPKAVVSLTFSNFSSAAGGGPGTVQQSGRRQAGGEAPKSEQREIKAEGEGLVSKVSRLTGDAFVPIDRAFCHGMYGDYITLTREITKKRCSRKQQQQQQEEEGKEQEEAAWETGSSSWYLEGQGGTGSGKREVKAAEVRALLTHFGLELSNPAVYLSQDLAKTFLFRASEHTLYQFYLCASGLESALNSLLVAKERQESAVRELKAFEETLLPIREAHAKRQKELERCKQVERMKEEVAFLKTALTHLQAAEAAAAADAAAAEVSGLERQLEQQRISEATGGSIAAAEKQQQQVDQRRAALQQQQQELKHLQEEQQQQKQQAAAALRQLRAKRTEAASLREDLEASKEMVAALNGVIRSMRETLQGTVSPSSEEAAELAKREAAAVAAAAALAAAQETLQQLRRASAAAQQTAGKARGLLSEAELRLQACQHQEGLAARLLQEQQQLLQRMQQEHVQRRQALKDTLRREQQQQQRAAAAAALAAQVATAASRRGAPAPTGRQQRHAVELDRLQQRRREAPQRTRLYVNPKWQGPLPDLVGLLGSVSDLVLQGRFSGVPLGPLGEYLHVDEAVCEAAGVPVEAAQAILEEHLNMHAATWLVGSIADQRLLLPLLQRHRWPPRIAVVNFNCSPYAPRLTDEALGIPANLLTLYKAIRKETEESRGQTNSDRGSSNTAETARREAMPLAGIHFLVDSASIERVAIAEDRKQLRSLLQGPQQQHGGGGGVPRGLREGYAWREAAHFKRQGRGTEGVPCAQGGARRPRGLVRAGPPPSHLPDTSTAAAAAAAAAAEALPAADAADGGPLAGLEEELKQEQAAEEAALQQAEQRLAAARRQAEAASKARAAAVAGETAASEQLRQCEEAEAKQQAEVQAATDSRDDARLALDELRSKTHRHLNQEQLQGLQEQLLSKERQRDEEERQGETFRQRLEEAGRALSRVQQAYEEANRLLVELQEKAAKAKTDVAAAAAALREAEEQLEKRKDEQAAAAAVAAQRLKELERKREALDALRVEAKHLKDKCLPLNPGTELPQLSAVEAQRRLGSLEVSIRTEAAETRDLQTVEAAVMESGRVLRAQEQQLLAPQAAAKQAEENSTKRTQKLVKAIELSSMQTKKDFKRVVEGVLPHCAALVFDHPGQRVSIQMKDRNQQHVTSDPRALSGGEKSCVQVAFLAALAKRSNSPVHIFDEVDVFMDERSRVKK